MQSTKFNTALHEESGDESGPENIGSLRGSDPFLCGLFGHSPDGGGVDVGASVEEKQIYMGDSAAEQGAVRHIQIVLAEA